MIEEQDKILIDKYLENSLDKAEQALFQEKMAQNEAFRQEVAIEQDKILIDKYLEDSLDKAEQALFQEKMAQNEAFRQEVETQAQVHADLQQFFETENLRENIAEVRNQPKPSSLWKKILGGALILGVIAVSIWWGMAGQSKPKTTTVTDTTTEVANLEKNRKPPRGIPATTPKPTDTGVSANQKPPKPIKSVTQPPYYLAYIPEFVFYSGSAFMGSAPDQKTKRVVKIYRRLPETGLNAQKSYYQFADTLSIYGKTEQDIQALIHEKSQERFHLLIKPDTFLLEINEPIWRELMP